MSTKVILDTDIGTDIDDAVCLAYLLAHPDCDLLGITTVTGEAEKRGRLASALCKVVGRDVPIRAGTELPLLIEQRQTGAGQAAALGKWEHDTDFPPGRAVQFLSDTIRANPNEVVLIAVGPMSNVGLLFATHPDIPPLLKSLVLMCGAFQHGLPRVGPREWNACCDPHATAIVYGHRVASHRSIGLDVTTRVVMPAAEVRERFSVPLLQPVLDFAEVWFQHRDAITFHDPLAAATIFEPDICRFEAGLVEVELLSDKLLGATHWTPEGGDSPHEIAVDVDPDAFFSHYFSVLEQGGGT